MRVVGLVMKGGGCLRETIDVVEEEDRLVQEERVAWIAV